MQPWVRAEESLAGVQTSAGEPTYRMPPGSSPISQTRLSTVSWEVSNRARQAQGDGAFQDLRKLCPQVCRRSNGPSYWEDTMPRNWLGKRLRQILKWSDWARTERGAECLSQPLKAAMCFRLLRWSAKHHSTGKGSKDHSPHPKHTPLFLPLPGVSPSTGLAGFCIGIHTLCRMGFCGYCPVSFP